MGKKKPTDPSKTYKVEWTVNPKGRTVAVKATLTEVTTGAKRSSSETTAQSKTAAKGKSDDVGGHIIGHRFIGDQGAINMFPQNVRFNNSAWKKMENEWAAAIQSGKQVVVDIKLTGGTASRPSKIYVSYDYIDVQTKGTVFAWAGEFLNDAAQTFDRLSKEELAML